MRKITVNYLVTDDEEKRLEALLPLWQRYPGADGDYPFNDWTVEEMFQTIMEFGSKFTIDTQISYEERRQRIVLGTETPADAAAGESK